MGIAALHPSYELSYASTDMVDPCASEARRRPLQGRAIAYDPMEPDAVQIVPPNDLSTSRPGERRDPYAVSSLYGIGADTLCKEQRQGLWIPAFAGTTRGEDYGRSNQIAPLETTEKAYAIAQRLRGRKPARCSPHHGRRESGALLRPLIPNGFHPHFLGRVGVGALLRCVNPIALVGRHREIRPPLASYAMASPLTAGGDIVATSSLAVIRISKSSTSSCKQVSLALVRAPPPHEGSSACPRGTPRFCTFLSFFGPIRRNGNVRSLPSRNMKYARTCPARNPG
jgi:hypothetical protein